MNAKKGDAVEGQGRKVLQVLGKAAGPMAPKQIGEAVGLESKEVSDIIKGLKAQGLVDSPVRCKWGITETGKASL